MDYLAHALWSYIFFHKTKKPLWAVFWGLFPDTISWLIFAIYHIFTKTTMWTPDLSKIPSWVFTLYNISHSIFVAIAVILIIWTIFRSFPVYMLTWPIHILMDIPTHARDFLPTPFLWPFSVWHFPGIRWSDWRFMIINYVFLMSALIYIWWKKKKKSIQLPR